MNGFFSAIDFISSWIWLVSFGVLPWLLINFFRFRRAYRTLSAPLARFPIISVSLFLVPILFISFAGSILAIHERNRVLQFLDNPGTDETVMVDGIRSNNNSEVLAALKNLAPLAAHHSHPTETLVVDIRSSRGEIHLKLGRDSGNKEEYWVFSPTYWFTTRNEIGRLQTQVFDSTP
jgi:hypothetical protein